MYVNNLDERQRQESSGVSFQDLGASISNFFPGSSMNLLSTETEEQKIAKAEKFEKFLGLEGMRVSMYIPTTEEDEDDPSVSMSSKGQARAKLVVIRYEKATDSLVFENKIHGQYQRLKISLFDDIASINKGYGSIVTPMSNISSEDRNLKFLNFQLVGKPEINLEFQSSERRDVAYTQFSRLIDVKKSTPTRTNTATLTSPKNTFYDIKTVAPDVSFASDNAPDNVSSFMKSNASLPKLDSSFYVNTIKAKNCLNTSALWFKWIRFIVRDAYASNNSKRSTPVFAFGTATFSRERLVVISTGGVVSYFKLHEDIKDEGILRKFSPEFRFQS